MSPSSAIHLLQAEEARLLRRINQGFSESWWDHYHKLLAKRRRRILSKEEHQELIQLTDQVERQETKRMRALVKLAKFRKQSLTNLMRDLGLSGKADA